MVDTHGGGSDLARLWDPLVRANLEPLRAYIENLLRQRGGRREKSPETTDDLLQETFLTAWKRRDRFDGDDQVGFLKWTKVIAFYTASAFLRGAVRARKSGRREVLFSELGGSPPARRGGPRPAPHEVEEEELEARRAEALRALDAEELELVELVYVSEKPVGDVAKDRAVTAGAVRKKLQRMFGRVRRAFRRLDSASPAGQRSPGSSPPPRGPWVPAPLAGPFAPCAFTRSARSGGPRTLTHPLRAARLPP